jgi:threonyl-tRNA synthetase
MAMAVQKLHPGTQTTIGPWIDRGFYYDFDTREPLSDEDLKGIKKEMQRIIKADLPFIREEVMPHSPGNNAIWWTESLASPP